MWATLREARKAAASRRVLLMAVLPEDASRREAALEGLRSLDGARLRSHAELWVPEPRDPALAEFVEEHGIRTLPATLLLSEGGRKVAAARLGEDAIPTLGALWRLLARPEPGEGALAAWLGSGHDPAPLKAYGEARREDPFAAAREPHRTWLVSLLRDPSPRVVTWAAARLVEADAPAKPGEDRPVVHVLGTFENRFNETVSFGNRARTATERLEAPPWPVLGTADDLDAGAPCWARWRKDLRAAKVPRISLPLYALMTPRLEQADRDWVLAAWTGVAVAGQDADPWLAVPFWLATDWLLLHGEAADWDAFGAACKAKGWTKALARLRKGLEKVPAFWASPAAVQETFCEDESTFWEHPDACLAQWGITREQLVERSMDRMRIRSKPWEMEYPAKAGDLNLSTTFGIRMLVDAEGRVRWLRPQPGYALAHFAPESLAYGAGIRFEPAQVGGVKRPSRFLFAIRYYRHP